MTQIPSEDHPKMAPPLTAKRLCLAAVTIASALAGGSCGGGSPSAPSPSSPTVTITATGVSPIEVRISVGGTVTFMNNDVRPHAISSDPIQTHTDCPAINEVGFLNPGQSRATGILSAARTCGFHDHTNELDPTYKGRIVIQ